MDKAQQYYQAVVINYLVEDVEYLLEREEPRSGILLGPVVNGIDVMGATLMGFGARVGERSRFAMEDLMNYSCEEAAYLYDSVRCGLVHQGTAKIGLKFFANYGNFRRPHAIYRYDKWLCLDSVKLAEDFVRAARKLWNESAGRIKHYPKVEDSGFQELSSSGSINDISVYGDVYAHLIDDKYGSNSGFDPDCHLNPDLVVPP